MSEIQTCLDAKTIFTVTLYEFIATIYIYIYLTAVSFVQGFGPMNDEQGL